MIKPWQQPQQQLLGLYQFEAMLCYEGYVQGNLLSFGIPVSPPELVGDVDKVDSTFDILKYFEVVAVHFQS